MNPFVHTAVRTLLSLRRQCPACKRGQLVRADQKHKTVKCKFCKTPIPPPKR